MHTTNKLSRSAKKTSHSKALLTCLFFCAIALFTKAQSYNYTMGKEAFDKGDYETAKDFLNKELDENDKNPKAYSLRSVINNYYGNKTEALGDLNSAIKYCSSKDKTVLGFLFNMRGDIHYESNNLTNALDDYNMAIKNNKESNLYFANRARVYRQSGAFEKALQDIDIALKLDDSNSENIGQKALILLAMDRDAAAEEILNNRLTLDPEFDYGYTLRAYIFSKHRQHVKAIDDIFEAYRIKSNSQEIRSYFLNFTDSNINYTLNKLNAKINTAPDDLKWLEMRGRIITKKLNYTQAIKDFNRCIEICDPADKAFYSYFRGYAYFESGNYDAAINDFMFCINNRTNNSWDKYMVGETYKRKGEYKEALRFYDSSIIADEKEPYFLAKRGYLKYRFLNDNPGAQADLNLALDINPESQLLVQYKAEFLQTTNYDTAGLTILWSKLNESDSLFENDAYYRPFALYYLGKKEEAIASQQKITAQATNQYAFLDEARFYAIVDDEEKVIAAMKKAMNSGPAFFYELSHYFELFDYSKRPIVAKLLKEYKDKFVKDNASIFTKSNDSVSTIVKTIPMKPKGSGTYEVSCKINELGLNFIFDTGASDISISQTEALIMLKNGYLSSSDFVGSKKYMDANGDITVGSQILLKKVDLGGLILKNVYASVVNNKKAPLLFGQSALSKYGKIEIDNQNNTITITQTERR